MSNKARIEIFQRITGREWDVGALAKDIKLSQSALSQHLKKLRDAKVVDVRRDAQTLYYSSQHDGVRKILDTLKQVASEPAKPDAA